jgi:DNA-binding SARP family transcriptional activator/tetratricopeptide (TPR) repeat protein
MRFALLGPLTVVNDAGASVALAGGRQRTLLACLLVRANTPVSHDVLIDRIWDGQRPAGATTVVRNVVKRLRQALGPDVATRIVAHAPGYLARIEETELDMLEFETLCRRAGTSVRAGEWAVAASTAAGALALWRGEPLLDVSSRLLRDQTVPRLEHLRLQALEDGTQAELYLGRQGQLVPRLRELTADHPLREGFHAQLMLSLALSGRRAEALAAYGHARRTLVDELGIEPGPELQRVHEHILIGRTDLLPPPPAPVTLLTPSPTPTSSAVPSVPSQPDNSPQPEHSPTSARQLVVPRQLPSAVRHFVGRENEFNVLSDLLVQQEQPHDAVPVVVIAGTAGIGKSALALQWAHQHADRFPDGQLYVNLRGFSPSGEPMPPDDAVRGFLTALGVAPTRIPPNPQEQAALYRSEIAYRRMLILLDNSRDAEQVRPLLPGSPNCPVLITSRNQLAELVALDGAVPLALDLLSPDESRDLLARRLGGERLAAHEQTVYELIEACARLPLALNIAAAHATLRRESPLEELVRELLDTRRRLDTLTIGDGAADVRAVFSWSYRTLSPDAARTFRLLGVHPGPDIGREAAARLTALDADRSRRALAELTRAHLLTEPSPGRYAFHDLLRAYSVEQTCAHDSAVERLEALRRVVEHYLHTSHAAAALRYPEWLPLDLPAVRPDAAPEHLADRDAALGWFRAERIVLLTVVDRAAGSTGLEDPAWQIAHAIGTFLGREGYWREWLAVSRAALTAALRSDSVPGQASAHRRIGTALIVYGGFEEAYDHLSRALGFYRMLGDRVYEGSTQLSIGQIRERQGRPADAIEPTRRALELARSGDDVPGQALALNSLGYNLARLGDYEPALEMCGEALVLFRKLADVYGEATTLDSIGYAHHRAGRHEEAIEHYRQALQLRRVEGDAYNQADILGHLGDAYHASGDPAKAGDTWRQALAILEELQATEADSVRVKLEALERRTKTAAAKGAEPPSETP